jgi:hypothetical protein
VTPGCGVASDSGRGVISARSDRTPD